ncbi:hypothetical protein PG996_007751 [Apiospora saccharicola]|uniref:Uncharacterized protein n=1 Tax=Apiospora saccharicola TaxID=335842 RepID=A0ABR1VBQ6_9PEZI
MSHDVDEKSQHEDGVAFFHRGKRNTTIRAVRNVWYKRACVHARHYKRFYIAFSIILVLAVTATAIVPSMIQMHRQHGQSGGGAKIQPSSPTLEPIVTSPTPTVSTSSSSSTTFTTTTTAAAPATTTTTETTMASTRSSTETTPSPPPSATCAPSSFTANAGYVGVYNPAINSPQFTIVAARSAVDCCRRCFSLGQPQALPVQLTPPRGCNGWGLINSLCSVVYDYPGEGANGTCPKGYPSVQISGGQGGERDFAGRGPCALGEG